MTGGVVGLGPLLRTHQEKGNFLETSFKFLLLLFQLLKVAKGDSKGSDILLLFPFVT
jgi:hypothetical protein